MDFVIISHIGVGKNLSCLFVCVLYEDDALATLRHCLLGSGKLDPETIRKTHPRLILAFSMAVGLG
jgi:hypothetical protein